MGTPILTIVFAGLVGGILWNLATWLFGLPSSSSHALFGGLIGAAIAALGTAGVKWDGVVSSIVIPALAAPVVAALVAAVGTRVIFTIVAKVPEERRDKASAGARSARPRWSRWPTAPTTRRRRWA